MTQEEFEKRQVEIAEKYIELYNPEASVEWVIFQAELGMECEDPADDLETALDMFGNYVEALLNP